MLSFDPNWRFDPPPDGEHILHAFPSAAFADVHRIIGNIASQTDRQEILEAFKGNFLHAAGRTHVWSTNESWAESDLQDAMEDASQNAPLFIEALYDSCVRLQEQGRATPSIDVINKLLERNNIGYRIEPPALVLRDSRLSIVVQPTPSLKPSAREVVLKALARSDELLRENKPIEAIQACLWILESMSTVYKDVNSGAGPIRGKYFNEISRELRQAAKGKPRERVLQWLEALHGFLSSPTGGGVRHGTDLNVVRDVRPHEALLYCNLIRSYMDYLLTEHHLLTSADGDHS